MFLPTFKAGIRTGAQESVSRLWGAACIFIVRRSPLTACFLQSVHRFSAVACKMPHIGVGGFGWREDRILLLQTAMVVVLFSYPFARQVSRAVKRQALQETPNTNK
eukprot:5141105-Amphidinium_carterae.1